MHKHATILPFFATNLVFATGFAVLTSFAVLTGVSAPAWAEKPNLTVYTYSSFSGEYGPGGKLKAEFEKTCDCTVSYVGLDDTGALLARLKLEGDSTKADVVLGLDSSQITEATAFMQAHSQTIDGLSLPLPWADTHFLPFDWGHLALIYDADKLKNPPTSLKQLVETKDGPKILIEDPRTSAPGFGFLLWMKKVFGDTSDAAWQSLAPRIITYPKGWSEAYELFLKGEADMVVSYTTSPAYHIAVENKTNYKAAVFTDGPYLQIEVMGVTKASTHAKLGQAFVAFMLSDAAQGMIPEGNWMLPAKTAKAGLPASFKALSLPATALSFTPDEVDANRRVWIDQWLAASTK